MLQIAYNEYHVWPCHSPTVQEVVHLISFQMGSSLLGANKIVHIHILNHHSDGKLSLYLAVMYILELPKESHHQVFVFLQILIASS